MKKAVCIPVDQYDKMIESYDRAMEELVQLRELLRAQKGDKHGCKEK